MLREAEPVVLLRVWLEVLPRVWLAEEADEAEERVACFVAEFCPEVVALRDCPEAVVLRVWLAEERVCASAPDGAAHRTAARAAERAEVINVFIIKEF